MVDYSIVGNNIRRLLRKKEMTQRDLADKSGLGITTITAYCNHRVYPSSRALQDMACALEVEVSEFFKEQICLGWLKHGEVFEFNGETYIVGHTDGTGQGRVWCLNARTRKRRMFNIDDGVNPVEKQE